MDRNGGYIALEVRAGSKAGPEGEVKERGHFLSSHSTWVPGEPSSSGRHILLVLTAGPQTCPAGGRQVQTSLTPPSHPLLPSHPPHLAVPVQPSARLPSNWGRTVFREGGWRPKGGHWLVTASRANCCCPQQTGLAAAAWGPHGPRRPAVVGNAPLEEGASPQHAHGWCHVSGDSDQVLKHSSFPIHFGSNEKTFPAQMAGEAKQQREGSGGTEGSTVWLRRSLKGNAIERGLPKEV